MSPYVELDKVTATPNLELSRRAETVPAAVDFDLPGSRSYFRLLRLPEPLLARP